MMLSSIQQYVNTFGSRDRTLEVYLCTNNPQNYVDTMSHPHSTTAHRYLTPAQIARAYAPAPASQSALIAYMQQASFSVTSTYSQHLTIGFKGTIGQAEQAFHIQINNYRAPNGRIFYAPGSDPSVPAYLAP